MRTAIRGKRERGQALILIALAVAGLLALTALAVDGSHVYAQLRQAQNAADTAAFAAALARIDAKDPSIVPAKTYPEVLAALQAAGLSRAADNSFADSHGDAGVNTGEPIDVIVNNPPDSTAPAFYVGKDDYVQVIIKAQVPTFFARIVGVQTLPIHVQAVAQGLPKIKAPVSPGNGIIGLGDDCGIVTVGGSALTRIVGGGIFSNSPKNGPTGGCYSFVFDGGASLIVNGLNLVGCVKPADVPYVLFDPPGGTIDCAQTKINFPMPVPDFDATCTGAGSVSGGVAQPGNYTDFPPAGATTLQPGKYCISGDFTTHNSDHLTGNNVLFIVQGDVSWQGGTLDFTPMTAAQDPDAANLLVYVPYKPGCDPAASPNRCHKVIVNAGTDYQWSGTIFAADSHCRINGTSDNYSLNAQVICYDIYINGTTNFIINYNQGEEWYFPYPPQTELDK